MDIKIRARLSAYSRLESLEGLQNAIPSPSVEDAKSVLGVGDNGKYTFFRVMTPQDMESELSSRYPTTPDGTVEKTEIDTLFEKREEPQAVGKDAIDTLFAKQEEPEAVGKEAIDTLFKNEEEPEAVEKEEIDTLFKSTTPTPSVGTVSFAEIDSLFS
jgi:hypothetical protein